MFLKIFLLFLNRSSHKLKGNLFFIFQFYQKGTDRHLWYYISFICVAFHAFYRLKIFHDNCFCFDVAYIKYPFSRPQRINYRKSWLIYEWGKKLFASNMKQVGRSIFRSFMLNLYFNMLRMIESNTQLHKKTTKQSVVMKE